MKVTYEHCSRCLRCSLAASVAEPIYWIAVDIKTRVLQSAPPLLCVIDVLGEVVEGAEHIAHRVRTHAGPRRLQIGTHGLGRLARRIGCVQSGSRQRDQPLPSLLVGVLQVGAGAERLLLGLKLALGVGFAKLLLLVHLFAAARQSRLRKRELQRSIGLRLLLVQVLLVVLARGVDEIVDVRLSLRVVEDGVEDRKSTRLNSSHPSISYAVFCLKKKKKKN